MISPLSLLLLSLLSLSSLPAFLAQVPPPETVLRFSPMTTRAPWAARCAGTVEQLSIAVTANGKTYPANSFVLHGGQTNYQASTIYNDVFISSDKGATWEQIGGGTMRPSYTLTSFPAYTKDNNGRLYKVAGRNQAGELTNEVWRSVDGGVTWTSPQPSNAMNRFSPRAFADLMTNSINEIEIAAGLVGARDAGIGLSDVWKSSDMGANWRHENSLPFGSPPGRSSASFLQFAAPALAGKSVLWYMGGYSRDEASSHGYHNDIYISTDYSRTWQQITDAAPWVGRGNFNAEITANGVIVLTSGYNDFTPGGRDNDLNDVWASMDGGWTWGKCLEDAQFADRRWQMTMLDNEGFFYIVGGEGNSTTGGRVPFNDVWRSDFTFNDPATLSRMCNVPIPICGVGLRCLPGGNTRIENGRVVCSATDLCTSSRLGFNPLTATAQWPVRHTAGLEITTTSTSINSRTYGAGSFVLWGGVGTEWNNNYTLLTDTWVSADGATWAQVSATGFAGAIGSAHCRDSKGRIFKIGGERGFPAEVVSDVWMSANVGRTWTLQTSASKALPPRAFADAYADSADNIFVVGGRGAGYTGAGMCDVWMSSNIGKDWTLKGSIPFGAALPGGRFSATLLIQPSQLLKVDVMTYIGGYSRWQNAGGAGLDRYNNDIWVSSNQGKNWARLTERAPFIDRDNFNGEVTKEGYIVVVGGYNNRETLNDVWVSADGGYTWGQCNAEAQFSDRRFQMTVMNKAGYLFVAGGEQIEGGTLLKQSDVWRSTVPLTGISTAAMRTMSNACPGVLFPKCTMGLSCWPNQVKLTAGAPATCNAVSVCKLNPDEESSSSGDYLPAPASSSSGLSGGMIALIVAIVVAVLAAVGYFLYKRKAPMQGYAKEEGLLGSTMDPTATGSSLPSNTMQLTA